MKTGNIRLRSRFGESTDERTEFFPESTRPFHQNGTYPWYSAVLILVIGVILFLGCTMLNNQLPKPVYIKDAKQGMFVAENAIHHLQHLTSMGPRVVGSYENEIFAVDFLKREIGFIMQRAKPQHLLTLDLQKPTGCYILAFRPYGFVNCYENIQNVVVKLSSAGNWSSSAVMFNCHFDSVPTSPGASDDGINCAVMLEVLRVLSQTDVPLKHNVIFLFNGAEENPLQGAHGFISQHQWASEVKAFINLEAAGSGGKEILFQTGPKNPWLLKMYADSAPHPHGTVVGEEIFQSGLVPSDTDFRVFRDFGNISGLDFAHKSNGYVYHTVFDSIFYIPEGTFQHTGDNMLALVKKIASSSELTNPGQASDGRVVYTDVGGLFMVYYSEFTGTIINMIAFILSLYTTVYNIMFVGKGLNRKQLLKQILLAALVPFLGWILSGCAVAAIASLLDACGKSMSWYSSPYIIFFIYYCPVLVCCMFLPLIVNEARIGFKNLLACEHQAQLYCTFVQLIWTFLMLLSTMFELRLSFLLMLFVLFPTVANLVVMMSKNHQRMSVWLMSLIGSLAFPTFLVLWYTVLVFELFIPITGRIGPDKNPEIFIGGISFLMCIQATSYLTPLIVLVKKGGTFLGVLLALNLAALLAAIATPSLFPYSANVLSPTTQRIYAFHTERVFYEKGGQELKRDAGYWMVPMDRHGPETIKTLFPEAQTTENDCKDKLLCGLPAFTVRLLQICKHTLWIPSPAPVIHNPTKLELLSAKSLSKSVRRLTFNATGPDHMQLHISPKPGVKLLGWSFCQDVTSGEPNWNDRPTYFIHYGRGLDSSSWQFWFDLEVQSLSNDTILDLALSGQYMTSGHQISPIFRDMLSKFPDYAKVVAWTSSYKHWQF
ncbi:endoplasmic reticulum metallopeptidase 1-like isoform X2 [Schistocerca nitens]|uniref:endoplasmic reticulum metallopeptidase 1-like isoform X2 n=1 Tax=Schistocerca nitens TaxID=7011 RepID=UPI002119301D|nr:endoplasmic reticulum metallopeptidase 1-like isoform X2 [Schistocerca nitens]